MLQCKNWRKFSARCLQFCFQTLVSWNGCSAPVEGTLLEFRFGWSNQKCRLLPLARHLLCLVAFREKPNMLQLLEHKDLQVTCSREFRSQNSRGILIYFDASCRCQRIYSAHLCPCSFSSSTKNKLSDSSTSFLLFLQKIKKSKVKWPGVHVTCRRRRKTE